MATDAKSQPEVPQGPDFVTVAELAKYLRVDRKTVYGEIQENRIPGVKRFGHGARRIRIYMPAVVEWAATDSRQKRR